MAPRFLLAAALVLAQLALADLASAQRGTVPVNVESVPPGATVYLDTTEGAPLGTTPLSSVRIARGAHTLIFRMPNYEEARLSVTVRRRRETFRAVLRALGSIEVSAANEGANGAEVTIDGAPVPGGRLGGVAIRVENLAPGRHQVRVSREGYRQFEQWVDVQGGQTVRVAVVLERVAPELGQVLVSSDVAGAHVFIDGQDRGTTPTVLDLSPGTYSLEVRSDEEGMEPHTQQILVQANARVTVSARLRPRTTAPTTGAIAIITDVAGAEVRINGQALPLGQYTRDGLQPGNYVVQVIAEGYTAFRREVQVTAGQTTSVDVQLARELGPPTRINVVVNVPNARVRVDAGDARSAPYVDNSPGPGQHTIVVSADGYTEQTFSCTTDPGAPADDDCDRTIELSPLAVAMRVRVDHDLTATGYVSVDGVQVGQVPYEGRVPVGDHVIEVEAEGYESYRQQMIVEYGEGDIEITATLRDSSEAAAAVATTHSALPVPVNHPMLDMEGGYPYLGGISLSIGFADWIDGAFTVRSMGRVTEFEGAARVGFRLFRQLAIGGRFRFGGGLGPAVTATTPCYEQNPAYAVAATGEYSTCGASPAGNPTGSLPTTFTPSSMRTGDPRGLAQELNPYPAGGSVQPFTTDVNTFFLSLELLVSLLLEPIASVSVWGAVDFYSDQYALHPRDVGAYLDVGPGGGSDPICTVSSAGARSLSCRRQEQGRFRLGIAVDFVLHRNFNLWLLFEGIAAQGPDTRRLYGAFLFDSPDVRIYPRAGFTFKF